MFFVAVVIGSVVTAVTTVALVDLSMRKRGGEPSAEGAGAGAPVEMPGAVLVGAPAGGGAVPVTVGAGRAGVTGGAPDRTARTARTATDTADTADTAAADTAERQVATSAIGRPGRPMRPVRRMRLNAARTRFSPAI
jgi:PTS system fructose-specific IIC component